MLRRMSITHRVLVAAISVTAAAAMFAPATAHAGHPCQSEWVKFKTFFDQNGAKIARGICQLVNKNDAAAAKKCVDDFEAARQKIDAKLAEYNASTGDSQGKIGPRGLGEATWATGTLLAERTFAGAPILSDSWRLELQRTGGKATKPMQATVCFLDSDGNMALPAATFSIEASRPNYDNTFTGVAGLTPVILLEKPLGLNGHQYQLRGTRGGEPTVVREARLVNTAAKDAKMRGGQ